MVAPYLMMVTWQHMGKYGTLPELAENRELIASHGVSVGHLSKLGAMGSTGFGHVFSQIGYPKPSNG